jgi:HTH-type transcriptional regulator / antitoxin HigA
MATPRTKAARKPEGGGEPASRAARPGRSRRAPGEPYFELVRRFPLRPIEPDTELERARAVLNELLDRDSLDRDRADYLEVLGHLIDRYEQAHHPLPPVSEVDMLRHFLDTRGASLSEAARGSGIAVSSLSAILSGKRRMNRDHIEALAGYFRVSPDVFLRSRIGVS